MSGIGDVAAGLLKTIAPTLAAALGGPLAGMATAWVAKKVLGKENATADEVSKMLAGMTSPDDLLRLKQAENDFKMKMEELGVDVFALEVKDRVSARDFGVKSKVGGNMQAVIATIVIAGFFYTVWMVLTGSLDIQDANKAVLIGTIIGYVSSKADTVLSFFFGSTQGSRDKTTELSSALQAAVKKT